MYGKTRGLLEDTGIILVLIGIIYSGYSAYNNSSEENMNILTSIKKTIISTINAVTKEKEIIEKEEIIIKKVSMPIEVVQEKIEEKPKIIVEEKNSPITIPITEEIEIKKEIEKEIQKPKNVDLIKLKFFLRELKFSMVKNIVKRDDLNSSISQKLKIRVTVLKNGTYEELEYVDGDKTLFEMNKDNILKVFPVHIADTIKDDFPRYVRFSIK